MIQVEKTQTINLVIRLTNGDATEFISFLQEKRSKKVDILEKISLELKANA